MKLKFCSNCNNEYSEDTKHWYLQKRPDRPNDQLKCKNCRRARVNKYQEANRQVCRDATKKCQSTVRGQFNKLRAAAKKAGRPVTVTLNQYKELRKSLCYYCSDDLPIRGAGLDRVDNSKGYSLDNVVPCCVKCNVAKRHYTTEEFAMWILRAAKWAQGVIS